MPLNNENETVPPSDVAALAEALAAWRVTAAASYQLNPFRARAQQIRHAGVLDDLRDPLTADVALEILRVRRMCQDDLYYGQGGQCG